MYFTDRGISELAERRGGEAVTLAWLAEKLSEFVDIHPEHDATIDQLATWLARADDDLDLRSRAPSVSPSMANLMITKTCGFPATRKSSAYVTRLCLTRYIACSMGREGERCHREPGLQAWFAAPVLA